MPGVTNTTPASIATCSDLMLGSLTVFVNDGGVTRVNTDKTITGGTVLGPGSLHVYCEDMSVSVAGDAIASHPPCPLPAIHCAAVTQGSTNVFTGGILGPTTVNSGGGSPSISDMSVLNLTPLTSIFPVSPLTAYVGPVVFTSAAVNNGTAPTAEEGMNVGLFRIIPDIGVPPPVIPSHLTRGSVSDKIVLVSEQRIGSVPPGGMSVNPWTITATVFVIEPHYYAVAYDIDNESIETLETNNSSTIVTITAT